MHTLITNNLHRHLAVSPEAASAALGRLDLLRPLSDALTALGLTDRASARRTEVPAATPAQPVSLALTWQLADTTEAHIVWTLRVAPTGDGDTLVSTTIRAGAARTGRYGVLDTSPPTRSTPDQQLLAAWSLLQPIIHAHTTRLLNAVADLAEHLEENGLDLAPAPLQVAA